MKKTYTNLKYARFSWLLLVILWMNSSGQTGNIPEWASVRERVSLHTDRDLYFAGEPLWFSASYFATGDKDSRQISQILYVELIDLQSKSPVVQKKFRIGDSRVSNLLMLPPGISSGTYLLRAYTLYMRNFPSVEFAHHFITVLNPAQPAPNGKLEQISAGQSAGLSSQSSGQALTVESKSDDYTLQLKVKASRPATDTRGPLAVKVTAKDGRVLAVREMQWSDNQGEISFPVGILEPGINYIAVTNGGGETVALHARYQPASRVRELSIETAGTEFHSRDRVMATYSASNAPDDMVFNISVVQKGTRMADRPQIPGGYLTDPLLVEDYLRSHPLISQGEIVRILEAHLQVVDPARFAGSGTFSHPVTPAFIPEIRDLTMSGIYRDKASREPIPDQEVYVSVLFNNPQLHISRTDRDGQFMFSLNNLQGINDIFITPETGINSDDERELLIRVPFSPDIPVVGPVPFSVDSTHRELVEIMYANSQVMERFHAREVSEDKNRNRTGSFNIDGDKTTILSDDYIALESLREIFIEIVPSAKIRRTGDRFSIIVNDQDGNVLPGKPLVMIDHVPVFNINALLDVPVSEIVKVEVINKTYILGSNSINGIVMITTKNNNYGELNFGSPSIFLELQTLEVPREDGFTPVMPSDPIPDFRTTLYWNSHALLQDGAGAFEFTTSDRKGEYTIIIEGHAPDGTYHYATQDIVIR